MATSPDLEPPARLADRGHLARRGSERHLRSALVPMNGVHAE